LKLLHQSAVTLANKRARKGDGMLSGNNGKQRLIRDNPKGVDWTALWLLLGYSRLT